MLGDVERSGLGLPGPLHRSVAKLDRPVLVWRPPNEPLALQGVEAVDGGLVGNDLARRLDLPDERGAAVLGDIALDILQHDLLFTGKFRQLRPA